MGESQEMDIGYVANLARIELSEKEKEKFRGQFGDILKYFDRLSEVDVEGVEPTAHAFPRHNVWDQDEARPGFSAEEALANAPAQRQNQVVVPKIIEE